MSECFYCEDGEKRKSLMIEICKLNYSTIYLNRNQKYPGRCVVKLNEHKTEYFQMTKSKSYTIYGVSLKIKTLLRVSSQTWWIEYNLLL